MFTKHFSSSSTEAFIAEQCSGIKTLWEFNSSWCRISSAKDREENESNDINNRQSCWGSQKASLESLERKNLLCFPFFIFTKELHIIFMIYWECGGEEEWRYNFVMFVVSRGTGNRQTVCFQRVIGITQMGNPRWMERSSGENAVSRSFQNFCMSSLTSKLELQRMHVEKVSHFKKLPRRKVIWEFSSV